MKIQGHTLVEVIVQRQRVRVDNVKELVDLNRALYPSLLQVIRNMKRMKHTEEGMKTHM